MTLNELLIKVNELRCEVAGVLDFDVEIGRSVLPDAKQVKDIEVDVVHERIIIS